MGLMELLNSSAASEERDILGIGKDQQAGSLTGLFKKAEVKATSNSPQEEVVINRVADEYKLGDDERKLLFAIRKVENGRQGREFGVLVPEAMRFEKDPDPIKSLETQAKWAAGTIKKRYKGNLEEFGNRWAPVGAENDPTNLNKNWVKNVKSYMENKGR